jgi:DNA-binding response OmpR family regulator
VTILLVALAERLAGLLDAYLEQEGYLVESAGSEAEAQKFAGQAHPDLILVDQRLVTPDLEAALDRLQPLSGAGIILLVDGPRGSSSRPDVGAGCTARIERSARPRALSGLVDTTLKKAGKSSPRAQRFRVGELTLDRDRHTLKAGGRYIDLTRTEFDLLSLLMSAPGQVFTRRELLEWVSGVDTGGAERTIDVHVGNLRLKLAGKAPAGSSAIETVQGVGYRIGPQQAA